MAIFTVVLRSPSARRCRGSAEPAARDVAGQGHGGLVLAEHEAGVGGEDESVELERERIGVLVGRELAPLDGGDDELADERQ